MSDMLGQIDRRRQSAHGPADSARMPPRDAETTAPAAPRLNCIVQDLPLLRHKESGRPGISTDCSIARVASTTVGPRFWTSLEDLGGMAVRMRSGAGRPPPCVFESAQGKVLPGATMRITSGSSGCFGMATSGSRPWRSSMAKRHVPRSLTTAMMGSEVVPNPA